MKKLLLLFSAILLTSLGVMAQSIPEGMRYQAIARDLDGRLLIGKTLTVQVELFSAGPKEEIFYTESHDVTSNELGLLDFVIGEGASVSGKFSQIPWATDQMWIRVSIKVQGDQEFQIISSGQLYSVPYAIYAEQAGEVTDQPDHGNRAPGIGMNSINWTLEGNYNSQNRNGGNPVLGTTDANNLVIVTKNIPRLVIDKDGAITIMVDVDINGDLNVDGTTTLNDDVQVTGGNPAHLTGTLTVDKATTLNDDLTVTGMNPTHMTGSLDVEQTMNVDDATTLNSSLTVTGMSATHLTGTLDVDGTTQLNDDLTVANSSPTDLTGSLDVDETLNVDGATTLNNTLNVTGESATTLTGTLAVDKPTTLNDALTVENNAPTHLTGSLTVDGDVNAGGSITIDGPLEVAGMNPTELTGTLEVDKLTTMESGLYVTGGGSVGPGNSHLAYFDNSEGGASDGIAIKLAQTDVSKENKFMTFYSANGQAGRIEGYQLSDIADIPAPTEEEIWSAVCLIVSNYNPLTFAWTQFATGFNFISYGWNNVTIPSFNIPDIPAFTIPDVPALTIPNIPAFVIPDVPGFSIPDIPGVTIPDVPEVDFGPYLCETICWCDCCDFCFDFNCCCETTCLIPHIDVFDGITIPDFPGIAIPDFNGIAIPDFNGINIPDFNGLAIPDFPGLVIPAVPAINLKNLFGEAPTIPTFNDILVDLGVCPNEDLFDLNDGYFKRLVSWALEHRLQGLVTMDPVSLVAQGLAWGLTSAVLNNGAVYGSKGADYAEYLPKMYPSERFMKGDLIGVYNGKISKNTKGADQILAITSQPLVLGNMPDEKDEANFEKVAFLGQVPVYVNGPVKMGDFIVPSGNNDGIANAVPADAMTASLLSSVLGKAWSEYDGQGIVLINTSIGLHPKEISEILKKQGDLEENLEVRVKQQRDESDVMNSDVDKIKQALGLTADRYNP